MLNWLKLGLCLLILNGCVLATFSPDLTIKERFIALTFWGKNDNAIQPYWIENDIILYREKAHIAILGNAVDDYDQELKKALDVLSPHFDITTSLGFDPDADIILNINRSQARTAGSQYVEIAQRRIDQIRKIYGPAWASPQATHIKSALMPIRDPDRLAKMRANAPCTTMHFFDDLDKTAFAFSYNPFSFKRRVINEVPDFSIIDVFVGLDNTEIDSPNEWQLRWDEKSFGQTAEVCLIEELVHGVALWRDLPDQQDRKPFSGRNGSSDLPWGIVVKNYVAGMDDVRTMLSYYDDPRMHSGLTHEEVLKIIDDY